jgi:hypothetical protein
MGGILPGAKGGILGGGIGAGLTAASLAPLGLAAAGLGLKGAYSAGQSYNPVLKGLAPLPAQDGLYLMQEGMADTYTRMNWEHPALIGAYGMLPGDGVEPATMRASVRKLMECWQWDRCWGWDFPILAMAAARVGEPELAIRALLIPSEKKNTYLRNGFCQGGPTPYFPGNGGLLWAVAMMAAGWDGAPARHAPGFPDDGQWHVRWEGLLPAP